MAAAGKGDGLMRWLVGGLLVGFVVLGLMIGSYAVGHNRGETKAQEAAPSTTAPATTEPAATEPATTEPATTEPTTTEPTTTTPADAAAEGKELFTSAGCAGCHTLADAGASGSVGPNLDEVKPSEQLVVDRVTNGKGAMPSFSGQLNAEQIKALATYVSTASGG